MKKIIFTLLVCLCLGVGLFFYFKINQQTVEVIAPTKNTAKNFPDTIDATVQGTLQDQINAVQVDVSLEELEQKLDTPQPTLIPTIEVFASTLHKPLGIASLPDGRVLVSDAVGGTLTLFKDADGDFVSDEKIVVARDLAYPSGIALVGNDAYVATSDRVVMFQNVAQATKTLTPQTAVLLESKDENVAHEVFVHDNVLYISTSSRCNECVDSLPYGAILGINLVTREQRVVAQGMTSPQGLGVVNGEISFFTWAPYTHLHENDSLKFAHHDKDKQVQFKHGLHPTNFLNYNAELFPEWKGKWVVVLGGSFIETSPLGYEIGVYDNLNDFASYESLFPQSFLRNKQVRAKPHAVAIGARGEIYITDSMNGKIFVITKK
ncbi:hypothetical protein IT409_01070 [Candidatus Falkowbacteria bacterium]|nr:hypothetical protein [Candidatus Falkowbacteria bacterium]